MSRVGWIDSGRPLPPHLADYWRQQHLAWQPYIPGTPPPSVVVQLAPAHSGALYLANEDIWGTYFAHFYPHTRLVVAGYRALTTTNYLDLLTLPTDWPAYLSQLSSPTSSVVLPSSGGVGVSDRLRRFFAGHGDDSIVQVVSRLRMTVQLAEREVRQFATPYAAVHRDLIGPARLATQWSQWLNRWENYRAFFRYLPFNEQLRIVEASMYRIATWMRDDGQDPRPLYSGEISADLDCVRTHLSEIEKIYVRLELPHSYR